MHLLGALVVEKFNARAPVDCVKFRMLPAFLMHWEQPPPAVREYWSFEPLLPDTDFIKFNNNKNIQSKDYPAAQALSHFSYDFFRGQAIMVDIQGCFESSIRVVLTDPAFHSPSGCFGGSDLGHQGFVAFFSVHQCNAVCRAMGLSVHPIQPPAV